MEHIKNIFYFLCSYPWEFYYFSLILFVGVYVVLIAPILFRLWIIPKIEKRYQSKLKFDGPVYWYGDWSASWGLPPIEMSLYAFLVYIGWLKIQRNKYMALAKINYDIKTASKAEIVMYFTIMFSYGLFVSAILTSALFE